MTRSRRWFLGLGVLGAAVVAAGVVALLLARHVAREMPPEREAALALLAQPMPPVAGRDASDALWLLGHDVPRAQHAQVAAAVRAYLDARWKLLDAGDTAAAKRLVDPRESFPRVAKIETSPGLCDEMFTPCLPRVRADPAATAASLRAHARSLQALLDLAGHDGVRYGLPPRDSDQEWPQIRNHALVLTYLASRFAAGETEAALAGTCADLEGWRRLGLDTDLLLASAVGVAYVNQDLRLLAEMLAELPMEQPLPPGCAAALAPMAPAEYGICPSIRYEYRLLPGMLAQTIRDAPQGNVLERLLQATSDPRHLAAVNAPRYARYCSEDMLRQAQAARPAADVPLPALRCGSLEHFLHPIDCNATMLMRGMDMNFDDYVDRRTDQAQALALMRTLLWLRAQTPVVEDWHGLLAKRPASLGLLREPRIDDEGQRVSIPRLFTHRERRFDLRIRPASTPQAGK